MRAYFPFLLAAILLFACVQAPEKSVQPAVPQPQVVPSSEWENAAPQKPLVDAEILPPPPSVNFPPEKNISINQSPALGDLPSAKPNPLPAQPMGFFAQWLGKMRQKDYANSALLASEQIDSQPENSTPYVLRSISFLQQNDTFHALPDAEKAVSLSPNSAEGLTALGHAHYAIYVKLGKHSPKAMSHYRMAESNYTKATSLSWWNAQAHAGLALLYYQGGKNQDVALGYSRAINANRSLLATPLGLVAESASRKNGGPIAGNLWVSYNIEYGSYVELYNYLPPTAMPNLTLDVPSRDIGHYNTSEGRAKYNEYISLGDAYAYNSNFTHAAYWYRQAKLSDPFNQGVYAKLSLVYWKMGKGEMAKSEAAQALKYGEEDELSNFAASLVEENDVKFLQYTKLLAGKNPNSFDYCVGLASAYHANAQYGRRDKQYDTCRELLLTRYFPLFMYEKV